MPRPCAMNQMQPTSAEINILRNYYAAVTAGLPNVRDLV